MENQTSDEQLQPRNPSRFKQLGRAVRRALHAKGGESAEAKIGSGPERSFFAVLSNGSLLEVDTKVLSRRTDFAMSKESEQPSDEYNVISVPDGKATNHVFITKEMNETGKYIPTFRAVRSWFDPEINDFEVKPALPLMGITDAFHFDEFDGSLVVQLGRGTVVSTVRKLSELPEGAEGTPEDPRDHELKLVLNSFTEPYIPEKSPGETTL